MCGRYTRKYTWREVRDFLNLVFDGLGDGPADMPPSYNVAPTQIVPIVRLNPTGQRELAAVRWGLVPPWAKDTKSGPPLINARAETAAEKPAFRAAFKARRCVVPVSGFYEWKKLDATRKQPMYITRADGAIMLLAGLWDRWSGDANTRPVESMTILTTTPNEFMAQIHDRMPAILEPEQVSAWLDPKTEPARASVMLTPAADGVLTAHPVSSRVNSPANNDASVLAEAPTSSLFEKT